ncbi:restriction endonuclease subunit S [Virgibacillus sp. DJP39]|uniref:restriction endonuclease subunit S n=1 Tax=Virgibacillus sp. DJP39 TaxID=3409790 RepID=UPI003BB5CBE6
MSYNLYDQYRNTDIEWLGKIPQHWEISKVKYIGNYINGYAFKPSDWVGEGRKIIRIQNLTNKNAVFNYYNGKIDDKYIVRSGDILLSWSASLGVFLWDDEEALLNQHIFKVLPNPKLVTKDFYLWLSKCFIHEMQKDTHGSTMTHLTKDKFGSFVVPLPSFEEQEKISSFLDEKYSEIQQVIDSKEKQIKTLVQYCQSLITETVTKGLDPGAVMGDSGIEWIGKVPTHWNIKRLGFLGYLQNGISKSSNDFGFGFPFLSYGDVYKSMELPKEVSGLVNSSRSDRNIYSVKKGDVFFTRTSETIDEIGITSTCLETIDLATFAGFLIRFRPTKNGLIPDYSKYYFRSQMHRKYFAKEMNLVTRASLNQDLLKKLPVLIPPEDEQIQISTFLDDKCSNINNLILRNKQLIKELKSYMESLIYEAVTGRIDVRNYTESDLEVEK